MTERRYLPILMTTTAALLWASSFTVVKVGLRYIDPYTFVFFRFLIRVTFSPKFCYEFFP